MVLTRDFRNGSFLAPARERQVRRWAVVLAAKLPVHLSAGKDVTLCATSSEALSEETGPYHRSVGPPHLQVRQEMPRGRKSDNPE
jgi:hypothetical protein